MPCALCFELTAQHPRTQGYNFHIIDICLGHAQIAFISHFLVPRGFLWSSRLPTAVRLFFGIPARGERKTALESRVHIHI